MILKGSQRGGAAQLARHLLKTVENEHVELYEVRGFMSDDLPGALHEAYAISRGTRCRQFLFSLSLSPPPSERVPIEVFESAIDEAEERLGLKDQPRVVIFHEKEGRRHAHCVWSRIDPDKMTAINLPFYKNRLHELSKEIYLEQRWQMPRGLVDSREKNPLNVTRDEWQQALRAGKDAKALKAMFQECWAASNSQQTFRELLEARGYWLAQGDRRGFVAIDFRGEVYALAKWAGLKTKEVRERLGNERDLPGVDETKAAIAARMSPVLQGYIREAERAYQVKAERHRLERARMAEQHSAERRKLDQGQEERWETESAERAARLSKGFRGLWDRLTGRYAEIRRQNEQETYMAWRRDQEQREALIASQLDERQRLQASILKVRRAHARERDQLERDVAAYMLGKESELLKEPLAHAPGHKAHDEHLRTREDRSLDMGI